MTTKPALLKPNSHFQGWFLFLCGICMGAADLIPGISGGTIAFILGFYPLLLDSLKSLSWSNFKCLFKGSWREFRQHVAWKFLLTLLAGILCAMICLSNFFHFILVHEVYRIYLYAVFFGLILASFVFCIRQVTVWGGQAIIGLFLGIIIAYLLTDTTLAPAKEGEFAVPIEINSAKMALKNYDFSDRLLTGLSSQNLSVLLAQGLLQKTTPVYNQQRIFVGPAGEFAAPYHPSLFNGWLVVCGILAICAMLLPGISGSYILTLLGVYSTVIEAFVEFINGFAAGVFHGEAFMILFNLGLGIGIGALGFARMVSWLLRHYPNLSLAVLSGFMIGAIRSVWPFWSYEYILMPLKLHKGPQLIALNPAFPSWHSPIVWQSVLCALAGFIFVFAMETYVKRKSRI